MLRYLEHKGHGITDYKKMLVGQKYTVRDAMSQLRQAIRDMSAYLEEAPTASQILDLDR
mgnify:CR=1 FL=1|jgi:hypothetical protein